MPSPRGLWVVFSVIILLGLDLTPPTRAQADHPGPAARPRARAKRRPRPPRPPGVIAAWPMPPVLIIRQTPEVHDEIGDLLGQLRR